MRGLADQHDARVADALEQRPQIGRLDVRERLARPAISRAIRASSAGSGRAGLGGSGWSSGRSGSQPSSPTSGTKRTSSSSSVSNSLLRHPRDADQLLRPRSMAPTGITRRPPIFELLLQRLRHARPAGGDDDRVVRRVLRPAERAVAVQHVHVVAACGGECLGGLVRQLTVALDRVDAARDPREHGGGVAGAGADLEHGFAARELQRLRHQRDDVGLRDRLAFLDRQRRVLVGELVQSRRQEGLARDVAHGVEHERVAHAARAIWRSTIAWRRALKSGSCFRNPSMVKSSSCRDRSETIRGITQSAGGARCRPVDRDRIGWSPELHALDEVAG